MAEDQSAIALRPARQGDASAMFILVQELAVSYRPERATFDQNFPRLLGENRQLLLVATRGGVVVGYVMASESMTLYANGPTTELMEMVVAPEHRGKGIGRMFIEAVIKWASERGCKEVNVPSRRAGAYYMRHGFEDSAPRYRFPL